jgi:hypothetical protein
MVCWQHCRNPGAIFCIIILTHAKLFLFLDVQPVHQTICVTDCTQERGAPELIVTKTSHDREC